MLYFIKERNVEDILFMKLEALINKHFSHLNENDRHIAEYIIQNRETCQNLPITELATRTLTSKSSILRLTKKLGFSGYSEFKYFLKNESQETIESPSSFLDMQAEDMSQTEKLFKQSHTLPIFSAIHKSRKIFCYGTGWGQRDVIRTFQRSLIPLQKFPTIIESLNEFNDIVEDTLTPDDLVIIVSLSGDIKRAKEITQTLTMKGIPILSITNISNNTLASLATYNLYFQSTPYHFPKEGMHGLMLPLFQLMDSFVRGYIDYVKQLEEDEKNDLY